MAEVVGDWVAGVGGVRDGWWLVVRVAPFCEHSALSFPKRYISVLSAVSDCQSGEWRNVRGRFPAPTNK
jgi:hypothetical protein